MLSKARVRRTIGFLSTWSLYEGTSIDDYTHALLRGVCAAAQEQDCNLLIGCGMSLPGSPLASRTAWPVPGEGLDFVPVGPWNTDGLIIIPDDLSDSQFEYVQELIHSGYPIILTTAEKPGPLVAVDNAGGIRQAFDHLFQHGHRQIAFLAGKQGRGGDSAERLAAYRNALRQAGLPEDERLIAFGEHRREDGRRAMQKILDTGAPFTALIASNDLSCIGAMEILRASGKRVPEDVAVIGFDDILEARSQLPPLTTVRHPTFMLGYQAVLAVLEGVNAQKPCKTKTRVATQLIIRQSCGCHPESTPVSLFDSASAADIAAIQRNLASVMVKATVAELQHSSQQEVEALCLSLVQAFTMSLEGHDPSVFNKALEDVSKWVGTNGENTYAWHVAFSTLRSGLTPLLSALPDADLSLAEALVDRARLTVADMAQRQTTATLLQHMETADRLGLMTSQLLAALDLSSSAAILAQHLPQLGIQHVLMAVYSSREDDPIAEATVLLDAGLPESKVGSQFHTRQFHPKGFYPADSPTQLAVLPLAVDQHTNGFVALSATHLDLCAAIVHNLAAALRSSQLYHDALEGRQLAEEANRLKSRFLSTVSHELRTPLSLIIGLSEMVLRERPGPTGAALRDIEQINTSAQHLARLIGDVLDLASSEAGCLRILRESLDLAEVFRVVVKLGEQMAVERGLKWNARLPEQGPWIIGDRTRLRQVMLNLISNAVKFTPQGQIALNVSVEDGQVVISVSDTGIGISAEEQEFIFQEFHRTERSVQSGYGGMGLGLTITKQLVEQHGGRIGVRSPGDLGSGSTFFFTLPVASMATLKDDLNAPLTKAGNYLMILTERADPAERLCDYLRQRGFDVRVFFVDERTEWLAYINTLPPAALLLGSNLAAREGWAIMGMLKSQPATGHIPVLAYSLEAENDRGEFLELNYSHKPLRSEQLADELARYSHPNDGQNVVLVVDDDPNILALHSRIVQQIGCQAITAHNGREALEAIESNRPDLILLDLMMPEMDGFAVLDEMRKNERLRDIPVIVLTARQLSEADLERCNRGVAAILGKGLLTTTETLSLIEAALTRQNVLGRATQQLVRQAMACIHRLYAEPLTREEIAREVGINADYLTDCFRQELSITPMTYLRRYRIRQARELLETSDLSVMQVALEVGFSDGAHFTRTFQREVGVTPRAYRRSKQG